MTQFQSIPSLGLGLGTKNRAGAWLEVFYPQLWTAPPQEVLQALAPLLGETGKNQTLSLDETKLANLKEVLRPFEGAAEFCELAQRVQGTGVEARALTLVWHDQEPLDVPQIYLNLHLLSSRAVKPHQINLSGIFGKLVNLAWTNQGPVELTELDQARLTARLKGEVLVVRSVDKFPPMADYVVPKGVRIADASRVRLGAYLGEGTTVMHEGFVNFNAGTLGQSMVEGRISAGVVVGNGSDLGGGCSTMGTLSGGNSVVISVGEKCLIGANAGVGIPLGDRCTLEAGLYLTAGSKVNLLDGQGNLQGQVKARDLSGKSDLLFRRNSLTGALECLTNKTVIELNLALHKNN
ncbi:MAG: 2,3,4,5-tetrahydropyridine-2,6-dicarboxylate N-succinyltransferase [Candidatus Lambdaproteobacteria bacterium RIFOXYD1_FULL_56_27]|nr:MAG: 2,3,4,5-tetrahydropyridine-2,6-dicarboxylate N-succinyltransferase [Candidatus Lambdaproteobacteria bacterium RIFOXYC1_FULL_56_13]OGH07252.1 MAG: 2,3,4,5-tetrahydropyridine-2,6-dicarboxylate N-succinyltransferase [Candidatus Lambdaproteobacteria bacterium RIFOXYD1_FULL_56_27]